MLMVCKGRERAGNGWEIFPSLEENYVPTIIRLQEKLEM
jgi:hypothetical protein